MGVKRGGEKEPFHVKDKFWTSEPEIDEDEAPTVRRIFARYLMGQSVGQICRDLTADGCRTARGGTEWSDHTVRHILQYGCVIIALNQQTLGTQGVALI